jgi:hypothetical protein
MIWSARPLWLSVLAIASVSSLPRLPRDVSSVSTPLPLCDEMTSIHLFTQAVLPSFMVSGPKSRVKPNSSLGYLSLSDYEQATMEEATMPSVYKTSALRKVQCSPGFERGGSSVGTAQNKAVQRRIIDEVVNRKNLDMADEPFSEEHELHPQAPGVTRGPEGMKRAFAGLHEESSPTSGSRSSPWWRKGRWSPYA